MFVIGVTFTQGCVQVFIWGKSLNHGYYTKMFKLLFWYELQRCDVDKVLIKPELLRILTQHQTQDGLAIKITSCEAGQGADRPGLPQ